jgi:V8-like Glu-specific endopeptidase
MLDASLSISALSAKDLDMELRARGALVPLARRFHFTDKVGTPLRNKIFENVLKQYYRDRLLPLNPYLSHLDDFTLLHLLRNKIEAEKSENDRGLWGNDDRLDFYDINNQTVRRNMRATVAVCMKEDLEDTGDGNHELSTKPYGETFHLCTSEKFVDQPIASGPFLSGTLVADDVVLSAAHYVDEGNINKLAFIFGFRMEDPVTPVTKIANKDIYYGAEIVARKYDVFGPNATESDWVLVRLNRKVTDWEPVTLCKKKVFFEQGIYILGHPCALPIKYASGIVIDDIQDAYFRCEADLYSSNSGSGVYCQTTHHLIGNLVKSDPEDFRWVGDGNVSVCYPNKDIPSSGGKCTNFNEFSEYLIDNIRE